MSGSHSEIVRALYASWSAGGRAGKDLVDPEIEYVNPPDAVEPGTRRGLEGWLAALRASREGLGDYRVEVERTIESGERVLALVVIQISAPESGIETGFRQGHIWTIRDGRARRLEWFNDPARAREIFDRSASDPAGGPASDEAERG